MSLANRLSASVFVAVFSTAAGAQTALSKYFAAITPDTGKSILSQHTAIKGKDGFAHCAQSDEHSKAGNYRGLSSFAKQFWSRMDCGVTDSAYEILDAAPKMDRADGLKYAANKAIDKCVYETGIPKYALYSSVHHLRGDTTVATFGRYALNKDDATSLLLANMQSCKIKLGL